MAALDLARLNVLVMEPSPLAKGAVTPLLRGLGVTKLRVAASPKDAFLAFRKTPADLVFADWTEEADGIGFTHQLRQRAGATQIPIILVTTFSDRHHIMMARDAGASDLLLKPISEEMLYGRIRNALKRRPLAKTA